MDRNQFLQELKKKKEINHKLNINKLLGASNGEIRITEAIDKIEASSAAGIYPVIKNTVK